MNRRHALLGMLSMGAAACSTRIETTQPTRRIERLGVQLYTLREMMASDASRTLAQIAAIGYNEVETAGYGNLDAPGFAKAISATGLRPVSAHVPINLVAEAPEALLNDAALIGFDYLVVPWLPPQLRTAYGYRQTIDLLNRFGDQCAAVGIQLCYHNHDFEFAIVDGLRPFDLMLAETDPKLVHFELDLFWTAHAGIDAASYLSADPSRYPLCHVKDRAASGAMVDVGQGNINFARLFQAGGGLQHYFVEHDRPGDALASITASYAAAKEIRF